MHRRTTGHRNQQPGGLRNKLRNNLAWRASILIVTAVPQWAQSGVDLLWADPGQRQHGSARTGAAVPEMITLRGAEQVSARSHRRRRQEPIADRGEDGALRPPSPFREVLSDPRGQGSSRD